ncbi:hypothetical protein [Paenibacillus sp. DMB5]|uniref:hypothetical protein n=1 Tax=Paenibacillus sp. DMB5 TaxID=1780103 RepID=UPI000A5A58CD|nr:hypothetical protein [Paenibacillus sp. DMB5]
MTEVTIRILNESDPKVISEAFHNQGWEKPVTLFQKYLIEQEKEQRVTLVAEIEGDLRVMSMYFGKQIIPILKSSLYRKSRNSMY